MDPRPPRAVFIEPRPPDPHIFSLYALPRLGGVLLATLLRERGWEVTVFVEEVAPVNFDEVLRADMVGISTITSTAPRSYALAREIRRSGVPVVLGGPHVTFLPEEGLEHADLVVRGEGEQPILALADYFMGGGGLDSAPGLSYRDGDRIVHNPLPDEPVNFGDLPAPDLSLIHGYVNRDSLFSRVVPIQTTRGCQYRCNFCSVTAMFGRKLRKRSPAGVVAELEKYRDTKALAFFYDDNFTASLEHARGVCRSIVEAGLKLTWSAQARLEVARDPGLLALMYEAGCRTLFIGFESVNPAALLESGKSQSADEMARAVRTIRGAGIEVHGMFIFGFDSDRAPDLAATLRFARKVPITTAQFLLLTPFPGTALFDRLKGEDRLLSTDWNLYDGHHVVFDPLNLKPKSLQKTQIVAHWRFYSRFRSLVNLAKLKFTRTAIYIYARRINARWNRRNRAYLKVLDGMSTSGPSALMIHLPRSFADVTMAAERARSRQGGRADAGTRLC
ncbi:MAG: radical SAM protein [bacterium]|nr:radical SAM protein [bacterium]MDT8395319.1 radical SAM protein [bacterium]